MLEQSSVQVTDEFRPPALLEYWKPVVGWEAYYAVSNVGRVRRVCSYRNSNPDGLLKPSFDSDGYLLVTLYSREILGHDRGKIYRVAFLVSRAFIGPRPVGLVINHKNGIKTRNWASNLEYVTIAENTRHAQRMGLLAKGARIAQAKLNDDAVREIRRLKGTESMAKIGRRFGVTKYAVWDIFHGHSWTHIV